MKDLADILHDGGYSLVVANGDIRTFDGRGVSDLYQLLENDSGFLNGASVADKVVGKAAASMMVLAKVKEVHADVVSQPALDLLESNRVRVTYGNIVPYIINRTGADLCPLETRCLPCMTLQECFVQIRAFMEEMKTNKLKE